MGRGMGGIRNSGARMTRASQQRRLAQQNPTGDKPLRKKVKGSLSDLPVSKSAREDGRNITLEVTANRECIKHITNDLCIFGRKFHDVDATKLTTMFKNSSFVKDKAADPNHHSSSGGVHFYYFKARGRNLYFNVAKVPIRDSKRNITGYAYRLYALTPNVRQ